MLDKNSFICTEDDIKFGLINEDLQEGLVNVIIEIWMDSIEYTHFDGSCILATFQDLLRSRVIPRLYDDNEKLNIVQFIESDHSDVINRIMHFEHLSKTLKEREVEVYKRFLKFAEDNIDKFNDVTIRPPDRRSLTYEKKPIEDGDGYYLDRKLVWVDFYEWYPWIQ